MRSTARPDVKTPTLRRETLRQLTADDLRHVAGGTTGRTGQSGGGSQLL